jgi:hypothetical protein
MSAERMLAGVQLVGMALSFALLLRARRLSVGLSSTEHSCQGLPPGGDVEQPAENDPKFRT